MRILLLCGYLLSFSHWALALTPEQLQQAYQYLAPINNWPTPHTDPAVQWQELSALDPLLPKVSAQEKARISLGKQLFFDPLLSKNKDIACASCHLPEHAFSDGKKVSTGHLNRQGHRNSPSILTSGLSQQLFWDGRSPNLTDQALHPIQDPVEMGFSINQLIQRLNQHPTYPQQFKRVLQQETINQQQLANLLASFQASLLTTINTPFERFMRGDHTALTVSERYGLHLFRTKARCMNCHFGPALSDQQFHNLGLTYYQRYYEDLGRFHVTNNPQDIGKFKTPSLRLVSHTGPWMHNGLFPKLEGVINMYNAGMFHPQPKNARQAADPFFPTTDPLLQPLELTLAEQDYLLQFLKTL
ncbi:cytochrome-c peroxidase [Thiopseudomonas alkaliphila]|uniref:Cytochrome-c peroxidase n=1 Tax=Thiopseudomonas alkaliphila TaxID=1697053 RepID=A0AAW7DXK5_9GAMM|nr:cytochrome c peroxidase [Thiopseudomonas alkaliphila]MDM1697152.1 cytochrome-c peroxidase [Thiopseudomonas alkaliphila]